MMPFAKVRVPVACAAEGAIDLYINKGSALVTRRDGAGNDWATLRACPHKVLAWFASASFAPSGQRDVAAPFQPCAQRLARLDQLKSEVRPPMAVSRFWLLDEMHYGFDAGQHIPYWLATNDANFIPLLVPAHQMAHFSQRLA